MWWFCVIISLCSDPDKEEILGSMLDFNTLGLAGHDDHGPQIDVRKARKPKLPSNSDEEGESSESDGESN